MSDSAALAINETDVAASHATAEALINSVGMIIRGKRGEIEKVLTCMVAGGHVLMEDLPGLGKTSMAKAFAYSIEGKHTAGEDSQAPVVFKRIQFTPDLLPLDLIGTYIFDDHNKDFIFKPGPLFSNIVLADEINRASPKVQSALLECMAENQITIAERTYPLDRFFFVIATQNPIEFEGTYPLPAAQLDRFFMKISFGYTSEEKELEIYQNYVEINRIPQTVHAVAKYEDILRLRETAESIHLHPQIILAVRNIVRATREESAIRLGASTRSGIIFLRCLRAYALLQGRSYVIEDDVQRLAKEVLFHRLLFKSAEEGAHAFDQIVRREVTRLAGLRLEQDG